MKIIRVGALCLVASLALGVSALMTGAGCKKCKPAEAALSERAPAAAGGAAAASAGAAGTAAASVAGAGAGAAGSIGFMALAGPSIAAIAAGAAISYCGYVVYDHYKGIELVNGEFSFNEKIAWGTVPRCEK